MMSIQISEEQVKKIAYGANGDARKSLTLLESIVYSSAKEGDTYIVEDSIINDLTGNTGVYGDKRNSLL